MRDLLSVILLCELTILGGCKPSGSSEASSGPDTGGDAPIPVTLTVVSGYNFDCFSIGYNGTNRLYCQNDVPIGVNTSINFGPGGPGCSGNGTTCTGTDGFILIAESDNAIAVRVKDDTLCLSTNVMTMPSSRTIGEATYCFGEATLSGAQDPEPHVYSNPQYDDAVNGSSDLALIDAEVMFAVDYGVNVLFDQRQILTDGAGSTSEASVSCERSATEIVCPDFMVGL